VNQRVASRGLIVLKILYLNKKEAALEVIGNSYVEQEDTSTGSQE